MGTNNLLRVPGDPGEVGLLMLASPSLLLQVLAAQFVHLCFNQTFDCRVFSVCLHVHIAIY